MNNLAFMRNLAGFDSGITNLSPEMLNLASPREQAHSPDSKLEGGESDGAQRDDAEVGISSQQPISTA
jgi:hypothetical protein